jgi:hypothetical protein
MTLTEENTCPAQNGIKGLSLGRYEGWKQAVCCAAHAGISLKRQLIHLFLGFLLLGCRKLWGNS